LLAAGWLPEFKVGLHLESAENHLFQTWMADSGAWEEAKTTRRGDDLRGFVASAGQGGAIKFFA
jgi:hypothetical protein